VKAEQGSGFSQITSLPVIITPPWWATWWFRSICVVALAALVYLALKKRIQAIRKQAEFKHRMAETEMMALRAQMNPHFIFNCLNGIDAMIHSDDKYRATMYLNKFAKLIRNVLESSKQNKVTLSRDLETLQLYIDLEVFRHRDKFSAVIHTEEELLREDFTVPPLIIQPYVENAILHGLRNRPGTDGRLSVSVKKEDDYIVYQIEDNGVGRKSIKQNSGNGNSGYGMQMSMDRIKLFNEEEIASVEVTDLISDGKPAGTLVQVRLKIHER
jgi:sensor histidine kinase YesM